MLRNPIPSLTNWVKVRHNIATGPWHQATDKLEGTDVYGTEGDDNTNWSKRFKYMYFDRFLFTFVDKSLWAIVTKGDVVGEIYGDNY